MFTGSTKDRWSKCRCRKIRFRQTILKHNILVQATNRLERNKQVQATNRWTQQSGGSGKKWMNTTIRLRQQLDEDNIQVQAINV